MEQKHQDQGQKRGIDLHVHTYVSDGYLSPSEAVERAYDSGVDTIAITDHDTVSGLEEAMQRGKEIGVDVIPGVEISARNGSSVHILGYFPGKTPADLSGVEDYLEKTQNGRTQRTYHQIELLNQDGYDISREEVDSCRKGVYTPKNAIVDVLVNKGHVKDDKEGLALLESSRYDVPYSPEWVVTPEEAVEMITSYGGKAVLAHPGKLMKRYDINDFVGKLADAGLKGIEVYSPKNSVGQREQLAEIANNYGLFMTYGTDFHRRNHDMGSVAGSEVDAECIIEGVRG
ncbi:PHP domain-containing protein [Candidatus Woesearchaeota archaeon]|nr:PHP domain-containing protein [Candidatus Woesearchaeota archaeon]